MAYVMLADPSLSYVSGTTIAVTGGKPILLIGLAQATAGLRRDERGAAGGVRAVRHLHP